VINHYLMPGANLLKRYGKCYVLITGGSQGLGKDYALAMAKRGFNLILLARGMDALQNTKEEILKHYPVRILGGEFLQKECRRLGASIRFEHIERGSLQSTH
jgi:NAD(P)-dependent dehydrogenase (short-subunit alcohol dehydrogenase family)